MQFTRRTNTAPGSEKMNDNGLRTFLDRLSLRFAAGALALSMAAFGAMAQGNSANAPGLANRAKLSDDLANVIGGGNAHGARWAQDGPRGRLVKVIISADPPKADKDLAGLRRAVLAAGGSVSHRFRVINGVAVMLPAARLDQIAGRSDVIRISPNSDVAATKSFLESTTGAYESRSDVPNKYLNGAGIGIAFLDSGIMASHASFRDGSGNSRVTARADLVTQPNWTAGVDTSGTTTTSGGTFLDPYGHGTLVASMAAGRTYGLLNDPQGIAPGAAVIDVRVLNENGTSDVATVLAGIDWVLANAKAKNIRVVNMSLGAASTESYQVDPLCRAARMMVASGLTVVVAAGNYGLGADGKQVYGAISSPGNEPSVITVGSGNGKGTSWRSDDVVNNFSSRGPTRGSYVDAAGLTQHDNLLKPDLIAPGNKNLGALSTDTLGVTQSLLALQYPAQVVSSLLGQGLMTASGTSFAAPVVSGAVAMLLQANPGLTPPLVKAMLQYTAQAVPGANLVQQGAGLLNIEGAVSVAKVLVPDISSRVAAGTLAVGDSLMQPFTSFPSVSTQINDQTFNWSRTVFAGGRHVLAGKDLFQKYQAIWDPEVSWVGSSVKTTDVSFDPATGAVTGSTSGTMTGKLLSTNVRIMDSALGNSSVVGRTGIFTPTANILTLINYNQGAVLSQALVVAEGYVTAEAYVTAEGLVTAEGFVCAEGVVFDEAYVTAEALVVAEAFVVAEGLVSAEGFVAAETADGILLLEDPVVEFIGEP